MLRTDKQHWCLLDIVHGGCTPAVDRNPGVNHVTLQAFLTENPVDSRAFRLMLSQPGFTDSIILLSR